MHLGATLPEGRIIGGFEIDISQAPWHAALFHYGIMLRCAGSIISNRWILTSGHCLDGLPKYMVRVGTGNRLGGGDEYTPIKLHIHEKFNSSEGVDYDFGLIQVKETIKFYKRIQPIQLPKIGDTDPAAGTTVQVTGWGITEDSETGSKFLRAVQVPIVDAKECKKIYPENLTERMICAGFVKEGGKGGTLYGF